MSCPYTSQQNGKAERAIRTTNDVLRSLLFQASMPPSFSTPFLALYGTHPTYTHLSVFGCRCYPNLSSTAAHKLAPRSSLCVFLGYSAEHKGYRCLDLSSNRVLISRHVTFDESSFPFAESTAPSFDDYAFLDKYDVTVLPIGPHRSSPVAGHLPGASDTSRAPRAALDAPPSAVSRMPHAALDAQPAAASHMPHAAPDALSSSTGPHTGTAAHDATFSSAGPHVTVAEDAIAATMTSVGPRVASAGVRSQPVGPPPGFPTRLGVRRWSHQSRPRPHRWSCRPRRKPLHRCPRLLRMPVPLGSRLLDVFPPWLFPLL
jgi:hypothetical protein